MFHASDLRANRGGQLSGRQQAMLRAARSNSNMAMLLFVLVMSGTGAALAFSTVTSTGRTPSGELSNDAVVSLLVVLVVVLAVIIIGYLLSRNYMATLSKKQINVAKGKASVASNTENNWQMKIGSTKLRIPSLGQMAAFEPPAEYRVYYIPGPVPIILSGEQIIEGVDEDEVALEMREEGPIEQDAAMQLARGGRTILFVLGFLIVEIPLVGLLITHVSGGLRWALAIGLFVQAIGFVVYALWRLDRK